IGQTNLSFFDRLVTSSDQRSSDVHSSDRTKQTAIYTCFLSNGNGRTRQLLANSLCSSQFFSLNFFKLGTTCFELFQCCIGCTACNFLWDQVVAGIAVAYTNDFTKITQVDNFFEQNN